MTRAIGRSLELYYIDGRPDGMLTAELFNWTGHVLMTPRTQIAEALARPEASYAGVYLLLGEQVGEPLAYIGEGEDISARIKNHDVRKEWWTSAVLVTASANKLNKAHVRYLEARLIAEARSIGRVPLDNGTSPTLAMLSEADVAKMEAFLENLFIVLPAVRVDMFIHRARPAVHQRRTPAAAGVGPAAEGPVGAPRFVLETAKHRLHASAVLNEGEFIVEAGSTARSRWAGLPHHNYASLHPELVRAGVLELQGDHCVFTQNYAFSSPSAAAAVIFGRSASGPQAWRLEGTGMTYRDWEARQLGGVAAPGRQE
ncbi:MAG: uncharacterized protein JWO81_766 [Alphaproteobacteria bacterium]|nr:uncharacterized protein [Alphaproteobacteria bacterium]